jgi:coenzyme Q-binding protein COQ10
MSAAIIETERELPYAADDLLRLVADVRAYPTFLPWLKSLRVHNEERIGSGWSGIAEAKVGWRAFSVDFATKVRVSPESREVHAALVRGPFRALNNSWSFAPFGEGRSRVRCRIVYAFKNPVLQTLVDANKGLVMSRIMAAFEGEAKRRFDTDQQ